MRKGGLFVALCLIGSAVGCSSARMSDHASDSMFREGRYEEAAQKLKAGVEEQGESGRDVLLYLLDLGLTLHAAGKYEESNKAFLRADQIAEIKDYTSLSTEAATLLTSDNIKDYKGEDFEKVLINTYLAMNFALMGETESALVEARKVNRKLYLMVTEGKRKYKQNAFARYLSAILYESEQNWNDAYVDYKFTHDLMPEFKNVGLDLYRMAWLLGMPDEMERWERKFGLSDEDKKSAKALHLKNGKRISRPERGEIIVLYENGISPIKRPHPNWSQVPKFYPRYNPVGGAKIRVQGGTLASAIEADTSMLHNIESTAIENLDEKWGGLLTKKIAGVVAKEVLAKQVENVTDSPLLGAVAKIAMWASDQADVRSWNLLPHDLQIARIPVDPGTYDVKAMPAGASELPDRTIVVGPGKKVFVNFRYAPR